MHFNKFVIIHPLFHFASRFKKLSAKLPASGLTIEKFVLTSWTVKAVDVKSGEEIYYNTKKPEKQSWPTQELALEDVGRLIGAEFLPRLLAFRSMVPNAPVEALHQAIFNSVGSPLALRVVVLVIAALPFAIAARLLLSG